MGFGFMVGFQVLDWMVCSSCANRRAAAGRSGANQTWQAGFDLISWPEQ
jgi:hypothetical protein